MSDKILDVGKGGLSNLAGVPEGTQILGLKGKNVPLTFKIASEAGEKVSFVKDDIAIRWGQAEAHFQWDAIGCQFHVWDDSWSILSHPQMQAVLQKLGGKEVASWKVASKQDIVALLLGEGILDVTPRGEATSSTEATA